MQNHFTGLDGLVLLLYFLSTMGIGFYFYRKSRSTEGFTAASRSLPGWVCGLSIFATYLSSISFLALPGKSYASNWSPFVFSLSVPIATWIAATVFLPYYRKSGEISAYAHLERRFGVWARMYASFFYLLTQLARMGAVMYLMALPLSVLTGLDIKLIILITGISVTLYSFVGGIVAVIWADALQSVVLIVGAVTCSLIMFLNMPEGAGQTFSIASQYHKFSLGSFSASLTQETFWIILLYGIVINLQNFGIDQNYVQRYIASKTDRDARKSVWLGGLLYVPVSALFFLIGTQLFSYYHVHKTQMNDLRHIIAAQQIKEKGLTPETPDYTAAVEQSALTLREEDIGDKVFPHFIGINLPSGITGLVIAAIFAAGMSTVSTSLNSSATLMILDWYQRYLRPKASEKEMMLGLYSATILWGLLGTSAALLLIRVTSALDAWWTLSGIFGGGMLGLFLLGMISRSAGNSAAATGTLLGIGIICWMTFSSKLAIVPTSLQSRFHAFLIPVAGTLTILLIGLLMTLFQKRKGETVVT